MGATYESVLVRNITPQGVIQFLVELGLKPSSCEPLRYNEIQTENAILYSSESSKGWTQIIANYQTLKCSFQKWFDVNPLAIHFSQTPNTSVHLWSLDSGFAAGYAIYQGRNKIECDQIIKVSSPISPLTVPHFSKRNGGMLIDLGIVLESFEDDIISRGNFEKGIATLISNFGVSPHLVDFQDAIDECYGITIKNNEYEAEPLHGWKVIPFATS